MSNTICIRGVNFQKINETNLKKIDVSNLLFIMISQSGMVDIRGNIYFFTPTAAFFWTKDDYDDDFVDALLLYVKDWNMINVYFCDFLLISPTIYDSFVRKLCARNIRDFWFETAIDIYKSWK